MNSRALTGLRGIAALVIVAHHVLLRLDAPRSWAGDALLQGYLAVDLFFVLSGFVMAIGYGTWFAGQVPVRDYGVFLSRRLARIWPLHTLVVLLILLGGTAQHTGVYWPRMVVTNLLLVQSWGFSQAVNPPSWSVSTELLAYILFPLLSGIALRRSRRVAWCGLVGALAMLAICVLGSPGPGAAQRGLLDVHQNWSVLPALRCIAGFSIGLLTWRVVQHRQVATCAAHPAVAAGAACAIGGLMLAGAPDAMVYAALPVLIAGLHRGSGWLPRALAGAPFYALGLVSYALYLVHMPLLDLAGGLYPHNRMAFVALFAMLVVPITLGAYWGVERPAQMALRRQRGQAPNQRGPCRRA